jgi:hypothetical protein
MATFDDVKSWVSNATMSDIEALMDIVKVRRNLIGLQVGFSFKAGDRVWFDAGNRGIIKGKFIKQNQKNAKVLSDNGMTWTVSPHLLHADKTVVAAAPAAPVKTVPHYIVK